MRRPQPFKPGDIVIGPSARALAGYSCKDEERFVQGVIEFAHPAYGWCMYRCAGSGIPLSTFNEFIFKIEDFAADEANKVYLSKLVGEELLASVVSDNSDSDDAEAYKVSEISDTDE